jgi:aminoglycoside 3-N-acetyltransferase
MLTYRDFILSLRKLDIDRQRPVIAHASLSAFGEVKGRAEVLAGALLDSFDSLIVPTFTYSTMVTPEVGPPNNALLYGTMHEANTLADFFRSYLPSDHLMGVVPEIIRQRNGSHRSMHPILSFSGVNAKEILDAQSYEKPLAPLRVLVEKEGWVLLMGVSHMSNTVIHLGERMAGRKTFIRYALTPQAARECQGFPPCSHGFDAIEPYLDTVAHKIPFGEAYVQAFAVRDVVEVTRARIADDPLALLCHRPGCLRCDAVREDVAARFGEV